MNKILNKEMKIKDFIGWTLATIAMLSLGLIPVAIIMSSEW